MYHGPIRRVWENKAHILVLFLSLIAGKNRLCLALRPLFGPIADPSKLTFLTNFTVCLNFPFLLTLPATYCCWLNAGFKSVNTSQIDTPFLCWFENVRTSARFSGCNNRISLCLMNWKTNTQSSTISSPVKHNFRPYSAGKHHGLYC